MNTIKPDYDCSVCILNNFVDGQLVILHSLGQEATTESHFTVHVYPLSKRGVLVGNLLYGKTKCILPNQNLINFLSYLAELI